MHSKHSGRGFWVVDRQNGTDAVRAHLERLIDAQGSKLWVRITDVIKDEAKARQFWIQLFVSALSRIPPGRQKEYDEAWINQYAEMVLSDYELKGFSVFQAGFAWPDVQEECHGLHASCEGEAEIPPMLKARTVKVLHAACAYVDAKRQHQGPRWMFAAAVLTLVFSCTAIAYGVFAHFGYHAGWLASFIHGRLG